MKRESTLSLFKEEQKFSAGHFTIFSADDRENLHGHNFTVAVELTGEVDDNGLVFDYRPYKAFVVSRCKLWNETFLLPTRSPFLQIHKHDNGDVDAVFAGETLHFLKRDVTLLPVTNVSLEELARLFLEGMLADPARSSKDDLSRAVVRCASGPGQNASCEWRREDAGGT